MYCVRTQIGGALNHIFSTCPFSSFYKRGEKTEVQIFVEEKNFIMVYGGPTAKSERSLWSILTAFFVKHPNQSLLTLNNNINIELANPFMGDI